MAYIRWERDNNFYIWSSLDGLNIWVAEDGPRVKFDINKTGDKKAAVALLAAIQDHLESCGYNLKYNKPTKRMIAKKNGS